MTVDEPRARSNASDAFEALFLKEHRRVRAIAARAGLDPHEAEDVAQDVFVQFHRLHPADAPYAAAWVRRAAVHLALNAIRARRRRELRESRDAVFTAAVRDPEPSSSRPGRAVEEEERRAEVRAVLARMPERHAAVLALRYSGLTYAEVAAAIGVPAPHVGSLLRRAESAFKKEFDHAPSR